MDFLKPLALCAVFVIGGCATVKSNIADQEFLLLTNRNDTDGNRPDMLLTGGLDGELLVNGQCLVVKKKNSVIVPIWPDGTRVSRTGAKTVISLPDNRGEATVGRVNHLGGAAGSADVIIQARSSAEQCGDKFFIVSQIKG